MIQMMLRDLVASKKLQRPHQCFDGHIALSQFQLMPILLSSLSQILCVRFLELHVRTSDVLYCTPETVRACPAAY